MVESTERFAPLMHHLAMPNPLWTLIQLYPDQNWDWEKISSNRCTTMKIIEDNIDKYPWNWRGIAINPDLNIAFVLKYCHKFPVYCWSDISAHQNVTMADIEANLTLPWRPIWNSPKSQSNHGIYP